MEVELSPRAIEHDGGPVVGPGRILGGGEGAEPLAGAFAGLADLGDPLAPASLPHATVPELVVVRATFALASAIVVVVVVGSGVSVTVIRCCVGSGGGGGGGGALGMRWG